MPRVVSSRVATDLRLAVRSLRRTPGLTVAALTCLALGIAATTTIYTAADAVAFHPVAAPNSDRLVMLAETWPRGADPDFDNIAPANLLDWQRETRTLEHIAAFTDWTPSLTGIAEPERVTAFRVTPEFFRTLEQRPALGRTFVADEGREGHTSSIILSDPLWRTRFGGDSLVVGKVVQLNGVAHTVIGVMPKEFVFPAGAELWAPLALDGALGRERDGRLLRAIGRLEPGASLEAARREASTIARQLELQYPEFNTKWGMQVQPAEQFYGRHARKFVPLLFGAVAFLLLISCANVANLLLAKATSRTRELAVRVALGARRGDLVRQLFTESLVVAAIGGAVGCLLSFWGVSLFRNTVPAELVRFNPGWTRMSIDGGALVCATLISIATAILIGMAPAFVAAQADPQDALKDSARGTTSGSGSRGRWKTRNVLVIGEIALACALVIGTGLLLRSFRTLMSADLGYRPDHVLTMQMTVPSSRYTDQRQVQAVFQRLLVAFRETPGVQDAAAINFLPPAFADGRTGTYLEGQPKPKLGEAVPQIRYRMISPRFFSTIGVTRLAGRDFTDADDSTSNVAIVTQRMAKRFWPGKDPMGKRFAVVGGTALITVVGVVSDIRHNPNLGRDPAEPMYFLPHSVSPWRTMSVVLRTAADPETMARVVPRVIAIVDPMLAPGDIQTLDRTVWTSMAPQRVVAQMLAVFALVAVVLAAVGIYGVMSYTISQRSREIGVRMALGATPEIVIASVLRQAASFGIGGVAIGVVLAAAFGRVLRSLLYSTSPTDALTFALVSLVVVAIAIMAGYLPARRAALVDPAISLRADG